MVEIRKWTETKQMDNSEKQMDKTKQTILKMDKDKINNFKNGQRQNRQF